MIRSCHTFKKREGFAFIKKRDSHSSLFTKRGKRAIRSFKREKAQFALFCQHTSDLPEKQKSKFPTVSYIVSSTRSSSLGYQNISYVRRTGIASSINRSSIFTTKLCIKVNDIYFLFEKKYIRLHLPGDILYYQIAAAHYRYRK